MILKLQQQAKLIKQRSKLIYSTVMVVLIVFGLFICIQYSNKVNIFAENVLFHRNRFINPSTPTQSRNQDNKQDEQIIFYTNINNQKDVQKEGDQEYNKGVLIFNKDEDKYYFLKNVTILESLNKNQKYSFKKNDEIFKSIDIKKVRSVSLTQQELQDFQYGNWCGPNYGGFNSNCSKYCTSNVNIPSEECLKCLPPINYLDRVCMLHDFCQERYFEKVQKEKTGFICAYRMINIGQIFQTRCECTYMIKEKLSQDNLIAHCESLDCIVYGLVVEKAFNNILFDCGCYYKEYHKNVYNNKMYSVETQKCVSPSECQKFGGQ